MLSIEISEEQGWKLVSIEGEIDFYSSPDIRRELLALAKIAHACVAIDLEKVSYIDSSGVATFIEAMQRLRKVDGKIALLALCESVRHVFEIARLESVFSIYDSKEDLFQATGNEQ